MIPPISLSMIPFVLALTATINAVPTERQVISATETGQSYNATSAKGCSRGHRHHHHHHHHHPNYNGTSTIASESVTVAVVGVSSSTSAPASATDLLIEPSSVVSAVDGSASDSAVDVISTDSSLYEPSTTEIAFATDPASGVTTDAATTESSAMISASSTVDVVTPTSSSSSTAASPTGDGGDDTSAWPEADEWLKSHNDIRAHYGPYSYHISTFILVLNKKYSRRSGHVEQLARRVLVKLRTTLQLVAQVSFLHMMMKV